MAEVEQYYQCKLRRMDSEMIAWISAKGAKQGAFVELLPSHKKWVVTTVYDHGLPPDVIKDMEANYRAGMPSTRDTEKDKRKKAMS